MCIMIVILAPTFSICRILSVHVILMRITLNQSLAYHLPNNWNQIPGEIKEAANLKQFKKKYKRFLLDRYELPSQRV